MKTIDKTKANEIREFFKNLPKDKQISYELKGKDINLIIKNDNIDYRNFYVVQEGNGLYYLHKTGNVEYSTWDSNSNGNFDTIDEVIDAYNKYVDNNKENKKSNTEELGDRMKNYEDKYELRIPKNEHIIVRLDGKNFSKYTKGFKKPFDRVFKRTMIDTTKKLVQEFNAVAGYVQSDEITLILASQEMNEENPKKDWTHIHNGRVQKISSVMSSYCTSFYNDSYDDNIDDIIPMGSDNYDFYYEKLNKARFDCRVYGVPNDSEAFNSILWRQRDCIRNSKSTFTQAYCSHKELINKNTDEQIKYTLDKTGFEWDNLDDYLKYGTIIKREKYMKDTENGEVQRTRVIEIPKKLDYSEENVDFIMCKSL